MLLLVSYCKNHTIVIFNMIVMCTNKKRIINRYTGKYLYVDCGWCPACLQQKAIARTNRIRNHIDLSGDNMCLFFTLTYRNECIPFFFMSDLDDDNLIYGTDSLSVPIYREYNPLHNTTYERLFTAEFPRSLVLGSLPKLKTLRNDNACRVSVCYYKDIQNFIKRLRKNLPPNENNISFFLCSEYGPNTCRAHFHGLLFVPSRDLTFWKDAISSAWPFDDGSRTYQNIEIAKDAASYVSSYVNSVSSLPALLYRVPEISPSHSYSKQFGLRPYFFQLPEIFEMWRRRDLHYVRSVNIKGTKSELSLLLPFYVLDRYFHKFKGFACLNAHEIFSICLRPESVYLYANKIGATSDDLNTIRVQVSNSVNRALSNGISLYDYALMYSDIWSLRSSQMMCDNYSTITNVTENTYAYDNIKEFYDGLVKSESLDMIRPFLDSSKLSPNLFPKNTSKSSILEQAFNSYSKDRKIRNFVYSNLFHV